jgi:small conductance mechanosensitive channel
MRAIRVPPSNEGTSLIALVATTPVEPTDEIAQSANSMWDATLDAMPRAGVAITVILIGWAVSRVIRIVARRALKGRRSRSFASVMSKIAGWIFLFLVVLIAIAITFPSVKPVDLLAGLGFFSVAVGFAFQDILENTLSGVLLLFRQPFRSGDQIEVDDQVGTVEGITIRETRITTFDGQLVIIPNRDVYKNVIRVQTANEMIRSSFVVGIAYENDATEAKQVIVASLVDVDGVAAEPAPAALVTALGVSTVDIEVRVWSSSTQFERLEVVDRAIRACKVGLDSAGIEMPADIVALQATPSFRAALHGDAEVTPGGALRV